MVPISPSQTTNKLVTNNVCGFADIFIQFVHWRCVRSGHGIQSIVVNCRFRHFSTFLDLCENVVSNRVSHINYIALAIDPFSGPGPGPPPPPCARPSEPPQFASEPRFSWVDDETEREVFCKHVYPYTHIYNVTSVTDNRE